MGGATHDPAWALKVISFSSTLSSGSPMMLGRLTVKLYGQHRAMIGGTCKRRGEQRGSQLRVIELRRLSLALRPRRRRDAVMIKEDECTHKMMFCRSPGCEQVARSERRGVREGDEVSRGTILSFASFVLLQDPTSLRFQSSECPLGLRLSDDKEVMD